MDNLNKLRGLASKYLMETINPINKRFYTQKEFEENMAKIFEISSTYNKCSKETKGGLNG